MQPTGRVTIGDVARTAGVSVATVSKVINGRYGVAPETELRVQEVIEQLGYESSIVARSLRSRRTNVIGILVAEFEPFSTELLKGISEAVEGTGYELMAYSGGLGRHDRVGWEQRYLTRLAGTLIDGAVLVTPTCADPLYRRSVRVSMGTVFQVPWTRLPAWPSGVETLREAGFTVAALALSDDSVDLDTFAADLNARGEEGRAAMVLGAEGDGLARATVEAADVVVRIPMAGEVDSLNVAAASAVAFWATRAG